MLAYKYADLHDTRSIYIYIYGCAFFNIVARILATIYIIFGSAVFIYNMHRSYTCCTVSLAGFTMASHHILEAGFALCMCCVPHIEGSGTSVHVLTFQRMQY